MKRNDKISVKLQREGELLLLDAIITGAPNRLGLTRTIPYDKKTLEILTTPYQIEELINLLDSLKSHFSIESIVIE